MAKTTIHTIPVQVDGMAVFDLRYAHGTSVATQITLALENSEIMHMVDLLRKDVEEVEYTPTAYINIITKDIV